MPATTSRPYFILSITGKLRDEYGTPVYPGMIFASPDAARKFLVSRDHQPDFDVIIDSR